MKQISRNILIVILMIICVNFHLPQNCFAQAVKSQTTITMPVESVSTPEIEIESKSIFSKWWIIAIGVVALGAVIALASGGGGGGDSSPTPTNNTGNVAVSW